MQVWDSNGAILYKISLYLTVVYFGGHYLLDNAIPFISLVSVLVPHNAGKLSDLEPIYLSGSDRLGSLY